MKHRLILLSTALLTLSGCKPHKTPQSIPQNTSYTQNVEQTQLTVPEGCQNNLWYGIAPTVPSNMTHRATMLCNSGYTNYTSEISHTGLWSSEYLTPERVSASRQEKRVNDFHPDPRLDDSATPQDYARSGYDRGHIAPSGDMPTPESQSESFSMANMAPQWPSMNRGLWADIEASVRNAAQKHPLYVVTGTDFNYPPGQQPHIGRSHTVFIPTHYWKAILSQDGQIHGVFVADNNGSGIYHIMGFAQAYAITHINPFPNLSINAQNAEPSLPKVTAIHEEER